MTTKNLQNKRGGAVHYTTDGTPVCDPWQPAGKFREVSDDVTCKRCIKNGKPEEG